MRGVIVEVTPAMLGLLCKTTEEGVRIKIKGVPEDAELVGVSLHQTWDRDSVFLKFIHDSFEDIKSDDPLPRISVEYIKNYELVRANVP